MRRGRRPHPLESLAAPAVLLLAALLRWVDLGRRSVWTDEGSTWTAATASLEGLIRRCLERDASPPLYYLLTSAALSFGDSEAWLRSVSFAASVALVWVTYRFARLGAPRGESALAALLLAVAPMQVMYAQEARTYALAALLSTASLYFFTRAALLGHRASWWGLAAATTLALYTQSLAVLAIGVQAVLLVLIRTGRRNVRPWLIAQLAAGVLFLPWFLASFEQAARLADSHWYIPPPDERGVFQVLRTLLLAPTALVTAPAGSAVPGLDAWLPRWVAHALLAAIVAIPLLASLAAVVEPGRRGRIARVAVAALLLPLLAVFVVSFARPLWLPRYFVGLGPFLAILWARGVVELPVRALRVAIGVLLVAVGAYGCVRYALDVDKEPWRDAVRHLAAASEPGAVALVTFDLDPYAFYAARMPDAPTGFEVAHPEVPFASQFTDRQLDEVEAAARRAAVGRRDVWVVVRSPNSEVRREVARRAERAAQDEGRTLRERLQWTSSGGPVTAARFMRAAAPDSVAPPADFGVSDPRGR